MEMRVFTMLLLDRISLCPKKHDSYTVGDWEPSRGLVSELFYLL